MRLIVEHSAVIGPIDCDRSSVVHLKEGGPTCPEQLSIETTAVFRTILQILSSHLSDPETDDFFNTWIVEEWRVNALEHGNKGDPSKKIEVRLRIDELADNTARILFVCLMIADEGEYFDPKKVPDPTIDERLDQQGGRGLRVAQDFSLTRYGHMLDVHVDPDSPPSQSTKGKTVRLKWAKFESRLPE